ncbi:hypothetical protein MXB_4121, partial [Myxobolus squamalis]
RRSQQQFIFLFENISEIDINNKNIQFTVEIKEFCYFCLQMFYKNNFCGPLDEESYIYGLFNLESQKYEELEKYCQSKLAAPGDRAITKYPFLLFISIQCLEKFPQNLDEFVCHLLIYIVWSQLFDHPISFFLDKSKEILEKKFDAAKKLIDFLSQTLEMNYCLTGVLGKRTKYQTEDLAQLVLDVTIKGHATSPDNDAPYLPEAVLKSPQTYLIGRHALYVRSSLENDSFRKNERTLLQLELTRMDQWYLTIPLPYWKIKELICFGNLGRLGCVNSAIEHYTELKSYDELIRCYLQGGRREKADNLVHAEIDAHGETPQLLCLLGQINDECVSYFEQALEINTIQPATWYNLGCSYLELNDYDKAATAFRTCCHIQPD